MADGSLCLYPAENDSAEFTLSLECSGTQVRAISSAVRLGELYFAGMRVGSTSSGTPTDPDYLKSSHNADAFVGWLPETSSVRIREIEGSADLYAVQIPMKLRLTADGGYFKIHAPLILLSELSLFGTAEKFSGYAYRKGVFYRKQTIFTDAAEMEISFAYAGNMVLSAFLNQNTSINDIVWNTVESENSGTAPLACGRNDFILRIYSVGKPYKHLVFRFTVWRNPEVTA